MSETAQEVKVPRKRVKKGEPAIFVHQPIEQVEQTERPKPRVSLIGALLNLAVFLRTSPKSEAEQNPELQEFLHQIITGGDHPQNPIVATELAELRMKGYIDDNNQILPYGKKLAMNGLSPTPNLSRLAETDANMAFAMFFAGFKALREIHIKDQDITPGKKGASLTESVRELSNVAYNWTAEAYGEDKMKDTFYPIGVKQPVIKAEEQPEVAAE